MRACVVVAECDTPTREEFVDAYAYAFANDWDPNGKNLSMLMLMLLLMVGIPSASSDACVGGCR